MLTNEASVGSGAQDPETSDNVDGVESTIAATTSMSITKSGPPMLVPGEPVANTLFYRNDGPSTATDVVLADQIPDGLLFRDAPGCDLVGTEPTFVTCVVGSVAPGAAGTVEISFVVNDSVEDGTTIVNAASVAAAGTESDPADNTSFTSGVVDDEPETPPTTSSTPSPTADSTPTSGSGPTTLASPAGSTTTVLNVAAADEPHQWLSATGVAVGGLLAIAGLLIGAGALLRFFGRRARHRG